MRRRELILGLGAASAFVPTAVRAQRAIPVVGLLNSGAPEQYAERLKSYLKGLAEAGFVEGQNVKLEYRWAHGDNAKLPALAADLVEQKVTVIATPASTPATAAAREATKSIPIVFAIGAAPAELGFVESLKRPGGNLTGVTSLNTELAAKRLVLFRELVPTATRFYAMVNPTSPLTAPYLRDLEEGARGIGIHIDVLRAGTDQAIADALAVVAKEPNGVLLSASDSFFYIRRVEIAALAARQAVAMAFDTHEYVEAGGLLSYGSDFSDVLEICGRYTGRVLKGEKPAELPVAQSNKFNLAINLTTAKALGLTVPQMLLAQTDEVIE